MSALSQVHREFEAALPAISHTLRFQFKDLPRQQREDALADATAATWSWWSSLVSRGKDPLAVGITAIAVNAAKFVRGGRKVGNQNFGRGCPDIHDPRVQRKTGLRVVSIEDVAVPATGAWRQWLQDHRIGPDDVACFSIDFETWLGSLPARKRQMAELLAEGHETGSVARLLCVTPAAVSIARTWLDSSWQAFQGDLGCENVPRVRRGRGRPRKNAPRRPATPRAELVAS